MGVTTDHLITGGSPRVWETLYLSPTVINVPENTNGTTIQDSFTVPGGTMKETSMLRIRTYAGNVAGGSIVHRVHIDGDNLLARTITVGAFQVTDHYWWNVNSLTSQRCTPVQWYPNTNLAEVAITDAEDTSQDFDIDIRSVTDAGESYSIYLFHIELLR